MSWLRRIAEYERPWVGRVGVALAALLWLFVSLAGFAAGVGKQPGSALRGCTGLGRAPRSTAAHGYSTADARASAAASDRRCTPSLERIL